MIAGKKVLLAIPARGGSVGVPGKNIRPIGGAPMIAHAIRRALDVPGIDDIVVSTDSPEIARIAVEHGARVPFLRPDALARSETPMVPVLVDLLEGLSREGKEFDVLVALQANSPLLASSQIQEVLDRICQEPLDVVFTVADASHPPQWTIRLVDGSPQFAFEACTSTQGDRRQDQPTMYRSTGAVYAVDIPYLMRNQASARLCLPAPGQRSAIVITDPFTAVDIDSELDFLLAATIFKLREGANP